MTALYVNLGPKARELYEHRLTVLKAQGFTVTPPLDKAVADWAKCVILNKFIDTFYDTDPRHKQKRTEHHQRHEVIVQKMLSRQDRT